MLLRHPDLIRKSLQAYLEGACPLPLLGRLAFSAAEPFMPMFIFKCPVGWVRDVLPAMNVPPFLQGSSPLGSLKV
jgi:hypothetical protein